MLLDLPFSLSLSAFAIKLLLLLFVKLMAVLVSFPTLFVLLSSARQKRVVNLSLNLACACRLGK